MASTSSSARSSQLPQRNYRVFLSFRGEDTRRTFTGHLYKGLEDRGIFTFLDDKRLEHGDLIPEELMKAIEGSQVAVIIFSENYATSSWCLNELVKIMECKKEENGKTVIPVFYDVDPSHVRNQTERFAEAFAEHELKYKDDAEGMQKVQGWRTALTEAANLKGCDIRGRVEADCVESIVDEISSKCKTLVSYLQEIIGIDTQLKKVESLLKMEINDVRFVWICGMGGVGKTTIAKTIFYELKSKFKNVCFLENIKENKHKMHSLQNILLSKLFGEKEKSVEDKEEGRRMLADKLPSKKVLIVLDDIDDRDQLDYLAKDLRWFGKGSRIIATARDKQLRRENDDVFEVETLLDCDAIKLFNQYAFGKEVPECFKDLTLKIVQHAKGLPLALKVLGSSLHGMDKTEWVSALNRIKENPDSKINENLKISYDGLEPEDKEIFLDIACFLRGNEKEKVMQVLESCYKGSKIGLRVLVNKSLVFISENDTIEMHDLIRDMGRYIVTMQKDPGERSRIWDAEDFKKVMDNNSGTNTEAIWLEGTLELCFSKEDMKTMKRLRILYIHHGVGTFDDFIEYLPNNLRYFGFYDYPGESLPKNFEHKRLVHLDLQYSSRHLWIGTKHFPSLRFLDLCESDLRRTPDFTGMPNLEYLDLRLCWSLEEVHPSLKCCGKLIQLNLCGCETLKRFPDVNVESLEYLNLQHCSSLEKFPKILGRMKPELEIKMDCSGIRELPSSIFQPQTHLTELHLSEMRNLVALPSSICKLKGLVNLEVWGCSKLESLPEEIGDLQNLEELHAHYTLISRPPPSIVRLNKLKCLDFEKKNSEDGVLFVFPQVNEGLRSLEELNLSNCNLIDGRLPEDIGCLSSLKELDLSGNNFEHLPRSIAQLGALRSLDLKCCRSLKELPGFMGMPNLETLNLSNCNLIDRRLPEDIGCLSSLKELNLSGNNFEHLPRSIAQLGALRSLDLSDCKRITELPEFPEQLDRITADWRNDWICNSLFQNISSITDISASDSLSLRVFTSRLAWREDIPSWFLHRGTGTIVSVNLPENWYVSDNFLGFAVCYSGRLIDITAHLIPLCDDGMSSMTQKFALSNHSEVFQDIHFFLVPFAGLWDTSKANGKRPNDYGHIILSFPEELKGFGLRLLYKDEPELIGIRRSRYDDSEHHEEDSSTGIGRSRYDGSEHHEEASCSSSKKQRSQASEFCQ